jgi:hypothetical protein
MQLVTFGGPTIIDPHSPTSGYRFPRVANFWKYLNAVLGRR